MKHVSAGTNSASGSGEQPQSASAWITEAVASHEVRLMRYATRLLGDVERARDVVQDTFLKLWEADRDEVEGHLTRWLFKVCRNRALDVLRKEGRMTALSEKKVNTTPGDGVKPSDGADQEEHTRQLVALLETLPPRQQEVVRLKFQGGLSYREISDVMNLTVSHVGVLIHTAVKSIRQRLEESGQTPRNATVSR